MNKTHIFLASIAGNFARYLAKKYKDVAKIKVVFVTTAANVYDKKEWMEDDIKLFEDAGFKVERIDFSKMDKEKSKEALNGVDIAIFGGGNPIYLLEELVKKDLLTFIKKRVSEGMIYVGSSAGAVIASPDVTLEKNFEDRDNPPKSDGYKALNLCNLLVLAHWGVEGFKKSYMKMLRDGYEQDIPLLSLSNKQAVEIIDDKILFLEV